ncbi:MAG TPA: RimK family alpha-L-glutamate ligase [Clostridia bacterium]|nr:RimK family alpha-L-glutamate ligase [Clostridia bacterium]
MKGLIINNAYNKSITLLNQSIRLKEEFDKLDVDVEIKRNDFFPAIIAAGKLQSTINDFDFCVYLDKDKYVSKMLEKTGLRVFNKSSAMEICDDKMETHIALANHNIPMPKTIPGLLCYNKEEPIQDATIDRAESLLSYPIIVKESYGSLGSGVFKADTQKELARLMEELKCRPHLFQEYISESFGKDIRVIVIGNKAFACMLRQSRGDFRSNAELRGDAYACELPLEYKNLCEKVSKILDLDYCGIDILIGKDNKPIVCEVNSNAYWGKIEKVTGKNVAQAYAKHIIDCVQVNV